MSLFTPAARNPLASRSSAREGSSASRSRLPRQSRFRVGCEQRVPLWDEMEQCFASPEIAASVMERSGRLTTFAARVMDRRGRLTPFQQRVRDMQEESAIELSNQSKERALVGEVI